LYGGFVWWVGSVAERTTDGGGVVVKVVVEALKVFFDRL
jgi:hypothetical protein